MAQKEMSGHDPSTTVMVTQYLYSSWMLLLLFQLNGLPPHGEQYKEAIMKMFDDCGKGKLLHFEQSR